MGEVTYYWTPRRHGFIVYVDGMLQPGSFATVTLVLNDYPQARPGSYRGEGLSPLPYSLGGFKPIAMP